MTQPVAPARGFGVWSGMPAASAADRNAFQGALVDPFGRTVDYVRLSVTDRCNLRCTYCMSEEMRFLPRKDLLSLEELDRLAGLLVRRGVRHIRLTGG